MRKVYGMARPSLPARQSCRKIQTEERMMKIAVLAIDLGKNVCSVVGLDPSGAMVLRRRVRRDTLGSTWSQDAG